MLFCGFTIACVFLEDFLFRYLLFFVDIIMINSTRSILNVVLCLIDVSVSFFSYFRCTCVGFIYTDKQSCVEEIKVARLHPYR